MEHRELEGMLENFENFSTCFDTSFQNADAVCIESEIPRMQVQLVAGEKSLEAGAICVGSEIPIMLVPGRGHLNKEGRSAYSAALPVLQCITLNPSSSDTSNQP
jgi:hypothetical protein